MRRRAFLRGASVLLGSSALGPVLQAFAATPRKATFFSESELRTLAALVDTILPATDSPAASAADTHYFIDLALPACATPAAQTVTASTEEVTATVQSLDVFADDLGAVAEQLEAWLSPSSNGTSARDADH